MHVPQTPEIEPSVYHTIGVRDLTRSSASRDSMLVVKASAVPDNSPDASPAALSKAAAIANAFKATISPINSARVRISPRGNGSLHQSNVNELLIDIESCTRKTQDKSIIDIAAATEMQLTHSARRRGSTFESLDGQLSNPGRSRDTNSPYTHDTFVHITSLANARQPGTESGTRSTTDTEGVKQDGSAEDTNSSLVLLSVSPTSSMVDQDKASTIVATAADIEGLLTKADAGPVDHTIHNADGSYIFGQSFTELIVGVINDRKGRRIRIPKGFKLTKLLKDPITSSVILRLENLITGQRIYRNVVRHSLDTVQKNSTVSQFC